MSRYLGATRAWVPHKTNGMVEIVFRRPPHWSFQPYKERTARAGDTMDLIAQDEYGDATRYWGIAWMNPGVPCPDDLAPDTVVRIPIET